MGDVREYWLVWLYEAMMSKRLSGKAGWAFVCLWGVRGSLGLLNASCPFEGLPIRGRRIYWGKVENVQAMTYLTNIMVMMRGIAIGLLTFGRITFGQRSCLHAASTNQQ